MCAESLVTLCCRFFLLPVDMVTMRCPPRRYKVGGDYKYEDKILKFDMESKTWRQLGEMKVARRLHAVSLVDDNGECQ